MSIKSAAAGEAPVISDQQNSLKLYIRVKIRLSLIYLPFRRKST
jgi:hypothetical protein